MNFVSVIIPVYNKEEYIRECIESVLQQTYQNIEIIMVNDFSTDASAEICRNIEKEYKIVSFIEQNSNQGPLAARVRGIRESRGDLLVFCDADDMLPANCIESLVTEHEKTKANMVIVNFAQKYEDKVVENKNKLSIGIHNNLELLDKQIDDGSMSGMFISSQCGKLYERKIIDTFIDQLPLNVRINEDGVFNTKYLLNSSAVAVIPDIVYIERSRNRIVKAKVNLDLFKDANNALADLREEWPDVDSFDRQMKLRKVSTTFILSFWVCNHSGFMNARKLLKKLWKELELKKIQDVVNEGNMRIYKRIFFRLMKHKCYLLFFVGIRVSPLLRKYVAR